MIKINKLNFYTLGCIRDTLRAYTKKVRVSQGGTRPLRGPEPSRSERKSSEKIFTRGIK
ncbi:hypothetical protein KAJ87_01355 [Candidatus Pacearchaeota archaeon]|nr:hypothetical protein [Candidatus Pacearchaeota archaeon]